MPHRHGGCGHAVVEVVGLGCGLSWRRRAGLRWKLAGSRIATAERDAQVVAVPGQGGVQQRDAACAEVCAVGGQPANDLAGLDVADRRQRPEDVGTGAKHCAGGDGWSRAGCQVR